MARTPPPSDPDSRPPTPRVALETTLLLHGVPRESAPGLAAELAAIIRGRGGSPALVGVLRGRPVVGLTDAQLAELLGLLPAETPKLNTANLGVALALGRSGATTVATTMELAAAAGIRVFATGGLGGVHRIASGRLDISGDLMAFTRFPVAVVTAGVKSILDVESTREVLEALGVPVVGFRTSRFPAFYLRESSAGVDERFDDVAELARFIRRELARTSRGIVVANPIPAEEAIDAVRWDGWLGQAERDAAAAGVAGRELTPFLLARVHELSGGATLRANIALVKSNAALAAELAVAMQIEGARSGAALTGS